MPPQPSKLLFMLTLVSGTMMSVSASTWMGAWMGLEINLLSFIPLISSSTNQRSTESSIKYFIIQVVGSVVIITTATWSVTMTPTFFSWMTTSPLILALLLKTGAAPVHFWFPGVMEGMSWENCMTLMTWQKIAPLMLISYVNPSELIMMSALMSGIISAVGGMNQTSLRKLMAYSSIGHVGWMLAILQTTETMWITYMVIYTLLSISVAMTFNKTNVFHLSQYFQTFKSNTTQNYILNVNLLSLGGLPPLLGFFPKWMALQAIISQNPTVALMLIMGALINLYYYLRLTFSSFIMIQHAQKWSMKNKLSLNMGLETTMALLSTMGIMMIPMFWAI